MSTKAPDNVARGMPEQGACKRQLCPSTKKSMTMDGGFGSILSVCAEISEQVAARFCDEIGHCSGPGIAIISARGLSGPAKKISGQWLGKWPELAGRLARRRAAMLAAGLISTALLSGCSTGSLSGNNRTAQAPPTITSTSVKNAQTNSLDKSAPVKIGLILPLSGNGSSAIIAKNMRLAGEMALFEFDNPSVQLIVRDSKGTPDGAQAAATAVLSRGAEIIIGPLFAGSVTAVKPIARQAGVPVIAFSSDPRVAGDNVYLLSFLAGSEVARIISYAVSRGKHRFAALIPQSAYGKIVEARFRGALARSGATMAVLQTYPTTPNGMLAPAKKLREAIEQTEQNGTPVDALFVPADRNSLPMIGSMMSYAHIDSKSIQLLGSSGWDFRNTGREAALVGGWFPGPDPRGWQDFAQRFAKTNGSVPPRIASLTFDAVSLAISLSSGRKGHRYTAANLTRPSGFSGTDGLFRFSPNGLPVRGLAILEVQKFGASVIDPAANDFGQGPAARPGSNTASLPAAAAGGGGARFNLGSR